MFFGRVFVLTGVFIKGLLSTSAKGASLYLGLSEVLLTI